MLLHKCFTESGKCLCRLVSTFTDSLYSQTGVNFGLTVFIADTSQLRNRGLMFAFVSSPYIATVWCGGPAAESFLKHGGFRWGFGTFSIVLPAMCLPLWGLFVWNYRKAKKSGLVPEEKSGRTFTESLKYYAIEFDIVGIFLIATGLALFLLPFSLYSYQKDQWRSPMIIAMIIIGGLLVVAFALWERYGAPKKYMPFELLADRTILGACILGAVLFVEFYIWDSYFSSFLQVVNNLMAFSHDHRNDHHRRSPCCRLRSLGALWCAEEIHAI